MKAHARPVVGWVLRAMAVLTGGTAGLSWLVAGTEFAAWVGIGGFGCIALTLLFALRAFSVDAGSDARGAFGAMARAEALRLVLAAVAFVALAITAPERFAPVMIGFCAALTGYWFALPFADRAHDEND